MQANQIRKSAIFTGFDQNPGGRHCISTSPTLGNFDDFSQLIDPGWLESDTMTLHPESPTNVKYGA